MNAITENVEIDTITDDDKGVLLIDFIAKLQKIVSQIPESSKMSARVEISPYGGWQEATCASIDWRLAI